MKINKFSGLLICFYIFCNSQFCYSQNQNNYKKADSTFLNKNLLVISKNYGDSIVLRWAPTKIQLWVEGNNNGYVIERILLENDKPINKELLTKTALKPYILEEWKKIFGTTVNAGTAAAQLLYGKTDYTVKDKKNKNDDLKLNELYNQSQIKQDVFGYALYLADFSAPVAQGMALRFVDKNFLKTGEYVYKIFAVTTSGQKSDSAYAIVDAGKISPKSVMPPVTAKSMDHTVKFTWKTLPMVNSFIGYYFERSDDNGKTYYRINNLPRVNMVENKDKDIVNEEMFFDSIPKNYFEYCYRIIGINSFGEESDPTDCIQVMGVDLTPPTSAYIISCKNEIGNTVKIEWKKEYFETDFGGFLVGVSKNIGGPYTPITKTPLPKTQTNFIDNKADPNGVNYYIITSIDTSGNGSNSNPYSVEMKDTIAPAAPVLAKSTIDSSGHVQLHWHLGNESDIMGYLVYNSNAVDHIFTPVTTGFLVDTVFYDTVSLNTLNKEVYYKIKAFDWHRNASSFSKIITIKKTDEIVPLPAVFKSYNVTDSSVSFSWNPSSSEDLSYQLLYRKSTEGDTSTKMIAKLDKKKSSYVDSKLKPKNYYQYTIVSVDSTGLKSDPSFPINLRVYSVSKVAPVNDFKVQLSSDKKTVVVSWSNKNEKDLINVYRRNGTEGEIMLIATISSSVGQYNDLKIQGGKSYLYQLQLYNESGEESILTKAIQIDVPK